MKSFHIILNIFVYIVVVCPVLQVVCQAHGKTRGRLGTIDEGHAHRQEPPCAVCPRQGKCVPKVQCPARLRPGAHNPSCHLEGSKLLGVCCFTGSHHAAEADHKARRSTSPSAEDVKTAHHQSRQKLREYLSRAERLLESPHHVLVKPTSPSYAHHLSVMTYDKRAEQLGRGGLLNLFAAQELQARQAVSDDELALGLTGHTDEPLQSVMTHDKRAEQLGRGGLLNLFAAQELQARQAVSDDELALGLTGHTDGPFCPPPPSCPGQPSRYRTLGGECNNAKSTSWGAVHTGYERLLPPDYGDGTWSMRASALGLPLPSARAVSSALVLEGSHPSPTHNLMFMQFGQFVAHDTSAGVVFTIGNGSAISCCSENGEQFLPQELQHWACAPIASSPEDDFYGQFRHQCLNMVRTQLAPASDCSVGYAKQMNGVTHHPDLSHLYGSSEERLALLRAPGGLLKTFNDYGRELPPLTERKECLTVKEGAACFESGDSHGNQIISLTVLHTLWTREHNRIARALARLNPGWDEDRVFWETRRILQAEFQHIIYSEWLPLLLGPQAAQAFGLIPSQGYSSSYDPHVNPSLTAEFATAAMRFGHSIVDGKMMLPSAKGGMYETISIPEVMFQPSRMRLRPFLDRMIAGLSWQPMQAVDPFVTEGLTRYLFHGGNPFGLDLASINIQRGRDYGIRAYNDYRKLVGLPPFLDFKQFAPNAANRLASVYQSPEDIDLWVGGLLEEPADGAIVGPTFAHILADQFSRVKRGDRYFYENGPDVNPGAFSPHQLAEIKKVSLARLICDNKDGIELLAQSPNAFIRADLPGNEPVPCDSPVIPAMDLSRFKEI